MENPKFPQTDNDSETRKVSEIFSSLPALTSSGSYSRVESSGRHGYLDKAEESPNSQDAVAEEKPKFPQTDNDSAICKVSEIVSSLPGTSTKM